MGDPPGQSLRWGGTFYVPESFMCYLAYLQSLLGAYLQVFAAYLQPCPQGFPAYLLDFAAYLLNLAVYLLESLT